MSPLRRLSGIAALTLAILPLAFAESAHADTPPAATYTVKNGDYLFGIAGKLKVKLSDLLAANNLTVDSVIVPGQQLAVPAGGTVPTTSATTVAPAAATSPGTYTVQSGDFLIGIARRMNV